MTQIIAIVIVVALALFIFNILSTYLIVKIINKKDVVEKIDLNMKRIEELKEDIKNNHSVSINRFDSFDNFLEDINLLSYVSNKLIKKYNDNLILLKERMDDMSKQDLAKLLSELVLINKNIGNINDYLSSISDVIDDDGWEI